MDDTTPATKGDIKALRVEMNEKFEQVNERFDRVNEGIDQVLTVLINVEKKVTVRIDDHEQRLTAPERAAA